MDKQQNIDYINYEYDKLIECLTNRYMKGDITASNYSQQVVKYLVERGNFILKLK